MLLLGGRGKNLPLEELAQEAVERCRAVVCFGEAAPSLRTPFSKPGAMRDTPEIERVDSLSEATLSWRERSAATRRRRAALAGVHKLRRLREL